MPDTMACLRNVLLGYFSFSLLVSCGGELAEPGTTADAEGPSEAASSSYSGGTYGTLPGGGVGESTGGTGNDEEFDESPMGTAGAPGCEPDESRNPATYRVPEDFDAIQSAIDASEYGDTIAVSPGVYDERVKLKSGIRLLGADPATTILDGAGRGENLIDFSQSFDSVVEGFTLRGVGRASGCGQSEDALACGGQWHAAAVYADGHGYGPCGTSLVLRNNIIADNAIGVMVYYRPYIIAEGNVFKHNETAFVANHHGDGEGKLVHNTFFENVEAVALSASFIDVMHNFFSENDQVLRQEYVQEGDLRCNLLFGNDELGDRFVINEDNNVEVEEGVLEPDTIELPADHPPTGCVDDSNEPIVPGPQD